MRAPAISHRHSVGSGSLFALAVALAAASGATAQTVPPPANADQAKSAPVTDPADPSAAEEQRGDQGEVIVTGSRIQRAGFDAPTPTTVIGDLELRQGNRPSIAQVLDDLPQFRATSTPATTTGNTNNSASTADLRGLGAVRTLTLLNGHRFTGSNDLNVIPQALIKRVDVVTGGASAAYGSGAVAGVVNIILDDQFKGLALQADAAVSSRGDDGRQHVSALAGLSFAGDRGHFMVNADYTSEDGAFGRKDRPNLEAAIFQSDATHYQLANDVNYTIINAGGVIDSGKATGYVFNGNGSISPLQLGSQTAGSFTVGGNGQNVYDYIAVTSPYDRTNVFARGTFDFSEAAKLWIDASVSRVHSDFPFIPETPILGSGGVPALSADNPFVTATARSQLAALGATLPAAVGLILTNVGDTGLMAYRSTRRNLEGAIGLDGKVGKFGYNLYYDHGELRNDQSLYNQRITANFNRAVDAVATPTGPACRVNADAITTNNDAACVPINVLGGAAITGAGLAYAFGANRQITTTKLDAAGVSVSGQPFDTWAGPVDFAAGGDFRWESFTTNYVDPRSLANQFGTLNFTATNGSFNVKEGFAELNVPLIDVAGTIHLDLNGAARYSDYSTSGGIWSWKGGGALRLVKDVLLRATYSRDIRSPTIAEYFTNQALNLANAVDPFTKTSLANVRNTTGGNPNLVPEIAHTLTLGGTISPRFAHGFSASVDYYSIDIKNAIATLALQDLLNGCAARAPGDNTCGGIITRDAQGVISSVARTYLNLAEYKTHGLDFEVAYVMPMSTFSPAMAGTVRFRALATRVLDLLINDGVSVTDRAGIVGDTTTFATPKWRATGSINYQDKVLGLDFRVRYVGGGQFNQPYRTDGSLVNPAASQIISNGKIGSRTYIDLGAQVTVAKQFTLFANVNNLFDRDPPPTTYATPIYDMIGRYMSAGAKLKF